MAISKRLKQYVAPDGFVYDYAEPQIIDGEEQHLYSKYLNLCFADSIDNYILVEEKDVN